MKRRRKKPTTRRVLVLGWRTANGYLRPREETVERVKGALALTAETTSLSSRADEIVNILYRMGGM